MHSGDGCILHYEPNTDNSRRSCLEGKPGGVEEHTKESRKQLAEVQTSQPTVSPWEDDRIKAVRNEARSFPDTSLDSTTHSNQNPRRREQVCHVGMGRLLVDICGIRKGGSRGMESREKYNNLRGPRLIPASRRLWGVRTPPTSTSSRWLC